MTSIITLIGDLGGGKTTWAALISRWIRQQYPNIPQVSNVAIETAIKVDDTNKFLAMKLMKDNKDYALVITDEAAQAGFESRGSGSKVAALESRVITLARKAHVDLILISQLMSMIDKRAQWLSNYYILCESKFQEDNHGHTPDYFEYTTYDNQLNEIGGFELETLDAARYIWPHMDTDDVPMKKALEKSWAWYYDINPESRNRFNEIMGLQDREPVVTELEKKEYSSAKNFKLPWGERLGEKLTMEGRTWSVVDRSWNVDEKQWDYTLQEVAS